jgi:hypothetical protein
MTLVDDLTKLDSVGTLLEGALVVADLLSSVASHVGPRLWLRDLERLIVVWAYRLLVVPEVSDEGPIASVFPLTLPAVVIDLYHDLVLNPGADIWRGQLSELLDEVLFALELVVDGYLLV